MLSQFSLVTNNEGHVEMKYYIDFPYSVYDGVRYHNVLDAGKSYYDTPYTLQAQIKKVGGDWANVYTLNPFWLTDDYRSAGGDTGINLNDKVQLRVRIETSFPEGNSEWSNIIGNVADYQSSDWAQGNLAATAQLGLIPAVLQDADLTQPITRAEFAAVAVKVYEALSEQTATPALDTTFTDTKDPEVLKAFNVGITNGISTTTDGQFKLEYTMPAAFADDKDISDRAKDSVYFMAANGIIGGIGNNTFAPRATPTAQQATDYAQAAREQALLIALRMVRNLK